MSAVVSVVIAAATCPAGQSVTADTAGHCCWGGQVWSKMQRRCVGAPTCPAGTQPKDEACVIACPAGQVATEDTAGRCCWPNQVWAASRNVCVGLPACPAGTVASGESCVAAAPSAQPRLAITAASFTFDLISILSIPNKVRRRGNLTREIRATEAQLQTLAGRARLLLPSGPLMFAFNSPVFTF